MRLVLNTAAFLQLALLTGGGPWDNSQCDAFVVVPTNIPRNNGGTSFTSSSSVEFQGTITTTRNNQKSNVNSKSRLGMFFADDVTPAKKKETKEESATTTTTTTAAKVEEPPAAPAAPVDLIMSDSAGFLNAAGAFLVDAFWLNSEHHQIDTTYTTPISEESRLGLIVEQSADLQEKYGERMGKRLTKGAVIGAVDPETKALVGLVTLKETLMKNDSILEAEKSEMISKNAVASLGPKDRRLYKDAPMAKIAEELLPADTKSVCVLSNLAVSPNARRRGIANALCYEVEGLVSDWGYDELYLLVEEANKAGRSLYENKLGYKVVAIKEGETAMRADIEAGEFKEIRADTLVMVKKL